MEFTLTDVITILIFFQSSLFSIYLFTLSRSKKISNRLIAFFIFLLGINVFDNLLTKSLYLDFPQLAFIINCTAALIAPLIFLYIKSVAFKNFKLKRSDFFHLAFFIALVIWTILVFHIRSPEEKARIVRTTFSQLSLNYTLLILALHLQTIYYYIASLKVINRYKQIVKENFSDANRITLSWLREIIIAFLVIVTISTLETVIHYFTSHRSNFNTLPLIFASYLFFVNWIIYKALKTPQIFTGVDSRIPLVKEIHKEKSSEAILSDKLLGTSPLNDLLSRLIRFIEKEKPYRDSMLSIKQLADQLDVPVRDLSLLINNVLNQNFFDFINQHRINEACELLKDPAFKRTTILEIMYEVGFNSKSSFNTAFKKYTGQTPTEYRQQLMTGS